MQAVILAGGKGARLKPHTEEIPKPLVPVGGKPIVEILLSRMKDLGVTEVVMCVNHLADLIEKALGDGSRLGLNIRYSHEDQPLSTVAPLKLIDNLQDNFLVANGDILTDLDFAKLYQHHLDQKAQITVATHRRLNKIDYGVIGTNDEGVAVSFEEKPVFDFEVSMGVYVFSKSILSLVPEGAPFGFDHLMLKMLEENLPINTYSYDGYWMDIGRPEDYAQAQRDIENNRGLIEE